MNENNKSSSSKLAITILLSASLIALAIIISSALKLMWGSSASPDNPKKIYENITLVKTSASPFLGNPNASVAIVEYIDFECPVCKRVFDDIYPQIKSEYIDTGKVKFIFKSLPIEALHATALKKTEAALCAYGQGGNSAFFSYHDILFNNFPMYNVLDLTSELTSIARQINLEPVRFRDCLNNGNYKTFINKDIVEALAIDATGTPTWLIGKTKDDGLTDTIKINGLHKYSIYKTILDQLLSEI